MLLSRGGKSHPFLLEHQGTYILSLLGVITCMVKEEYFSLEAARNAKWSLSTWRGENKGISGKAGGEMVPEGSLQG